jgi:histidinol-phosphate aminotransferase
MSRYWSELVSRLTPYVPGEQPRIEGLVKLNTNENPYPPSPRVLAAIRAVNEDQLKLYPDPQSTALRNALAARFGLEPAQVFVGNGSDEVLAFAFMGLLKQALPLHFPDITYSFYPVWCDLAGIDYRQVPVSDSFGVEPADYPAENGGIIIPNPNAPTGKVLALDSIRALLERSTDSVVVVDEAYIDFGGRSAVELIPEYDNLLVVQTLSKSRSLAGIRVGYAMGHTDLVEALDRVKNSFNSYPLDAVAQQAVLASLEDEAYFRETCQRVMATRDALCGRLQKLGFEVLPSSANFVFAHHGERAGRELFEALREHKVLVRYFDKPRIDNYLRITIGTPAQCDALVSALEAILADRASAVTG